jgi:hypothetical protein
MAIAVDTDMAVVADMPVGTAAVADMPDEHPMAA